MAEQALSGLRVLDLGHLIAGPFCAKLLADYGADVIKVEKPGRGDIARSMGPFAGNVPHPEKSGLFLHLNTNKRGITLDLASPTGQRIVKELVKEVDVVVENFRPGVMASWGLSYEELSQINPNLIMASITNFGQSGPYRDYVGTELTLYAMGGKMNRTGLEGREPIKLAGNQHQYQAGNCAAMATMFAYYGREYAGLGGQYLDVSIYETLMASYNARMPYLTDWAYTGERGVRPPPGGLAGYPSGFYPTKEGYLIITGATLYWPRTAALLGRPELATDPKFSGTGQLDPAAKEEFETTIWYPWLMERTAIEALEAAQEHEILSGIFATMDQVFASPQFEARGFFIEVDHPVAGKFKQMGAPFKTTDGWWQIRRPAPTLGEHNQEVLCGQLGYSKEDLVRMRERGII